MTKRQCKLEFLSPLNLFSSFIVASKTRGQCHKCDIGLQSSNPVNYTLKDFVTFLTGSEDGQLGGDDEGGPQKDLDQPPHFNDLSATSF